MNQLNLNLADGQDAYRPLFFENLAAIASLPNSRVLVSDSERGLLTEIDLKSGRQTFRKAYNVEDYADVYGLDYHDGKIYSVRQNCIYVADYENEKDYLDPQLFLEIPNCSDLVGIAVTESSIYLVTAKQSLLVVDRNTQDVNTLGTSFGVGLDDLCYFQNKLYIVDAKEQTVYVFNLSTNTITAQFLTPFENPTGIAVVRHPKSSQDVFYVAYARPSYEIYDTGDSEFQLKLESPLKDNFIHPLVCHFDIDQQAGLSNGFLIEMYYVEKLHALPEIIKEYGTVKDLDWKISLPLNTDRQQLLAVEPIGDFPMKIETLPEETDRQVAVFSLPELNLATERRVFGWKAIIKTQSIKYCPIPEQIREISSEELEKYAQYLQDEPGLDLDNSNVIQVAKDAISGLSDSEKNNALLKARAIRDYIYSELTYVMDSDHKGTADVLRDRQGSCGEYLNVFLSLFRLNQIPTRTCGNYKVPAYKMQAGSKSVFLSPDFNHVWLQFYVPGLGWMPLESSADDEASTSRAWAQRYFLGLSWYHIECRIGSYFEDVFERDGNTPFFLSAGELGKNDIKFKVLGEI